MKNNAVVAAQPRQIHGLRMMSTRAFPKKLCPLVYIDNVRTIGSGARKCAAHRLHRLTHERPGADSPSATPDTALVQRPWQGTRERDGQERAGRLTASLIGTWSDTAQKRQSDGAGDFYGHPAVPMGQA